MRQATPLFRARFGVPDGYVAVERTVRADRETAARWLKSARQRRYDRAAHDGECVVLTRHLLRCPHCGFESPAIPRPLTSKRLPDRAIDEWISRADGAQLRLRIGAPWNSTHRCPRCGQISKTRTKTAPVRIEADAHSARLACESADIHELLRLMSFFGVSTMEAALPFTETVVFDFAAGRVTLSVSDTEHASAPVDVTFARKAWAWCIAHRLLEDSWLVRRRLAQAFAAAWGEPVPFAQRALCPEDFVAMTLFQRYPRDFYDAMPCRLADGDLDESFRPAAERLRDARALPALYDASGLPHIKTVRRLFFQNPGYFFYLDEAAALWDALDDPNHFMRMMTRPAAFEMLAFFHQYPRAVEFFRDWLLCKGANSLFRRLEEDWQPLSSYALCYCMMSPAAQAAERAKWKRERPGCRPPIPFSTAMTSSGAPEDCEVDGYFFTRLRSKSDFLAAGRAMHNCLVRWESRTHPVFAVKRGGECAAAIELDGDTVVTALAPRNREIEAGSRLERAVEKWMRSHRLRRAPNRTPFDDFDDFDDDDIDELLEALHQITEQDDLPDEDG